jgi:hypothetical protein
MKYLAIEKRKLLEGKGDEEDLKLTSNDNNTSDDEEVSA